MADVLFISHTWLRANEPDRDDVKINVIRALLHKVVDGTFPDVHPHFIAAEYFGRFKIGGKQISSSLRDGFVWIDIMSIPQRNPESQLLAINSIVSYVAASAYFMVLAGNWKHDSGQVRDVRGWQKRGWCRMEMTANALSPMSKPLLVAQSPTVIDMHAPSGLSFKGFLLDPVGRGDFTVDGDKRYLGGVIRALIASRKEYALATGDLFFFRVLHACTRRLLDGTGADEELPDESFKDWMQTMQFDLEDCSEGRRGRCDMHSPKRGMTPLRYAAGLAGNVALTKACLAMPGVDIERPLSKAINLFDAPPKYTILMHACAMHDNVELVQLLLDSRADPVAQDAGVGANALGHCCATGHTRVADLLVSRSKPLGDPRQITWNPPRDHWMWGKGENARNVAHNYVFYSEYGHAAALRHAMEAQPEELAQCYTIPSKIGIGMLNWACVAIGDVDTLLVTIEQAKEFGVLEQSLHRAEVNVAPGFVSFIRLLRSPVGFLLPFPRHVRDTLSQVFTECTPLHQSAFFGNLGQTEALLKARALVNTQAHPYRRTPLMLACLAGHENVSAMLIAAGAALGIKDKLGKTASSIAMSRGHRALAVLTQTPAKGPGTILPRILPHTHVAPQAERMHGEGAPRAGGAPKK